MMKLQPPRNFSLTGISEDSSTGFFSGSATFNEEVKRKLKSSQAFETAPSSAKFARYADLRYTKFEINGFPGEKHAVFVPDNLTLSPHVFQQICDSLDKEAPSMFLTGVSSLCHPTKLSTTQLRKCPGFSPLMSDVRNSLGIKQRGNDSRDSDVSNKRLVENVDHYLEKKLASSIGSIASAAFRTDVWTFSGPQISNFEMLLQQNIENDDTDVFRMVAAHMQDRSYMECTTAKQLMKDIFDSSQVMSAEAVDNTQPLILNSDLWDPTVNKANPEFAEHGYEYWSFDSLDQKMINGHPITQWPWPHANLFVLFYREENITGAAQADVDWEFSTRTKLEEEVVLFAPETVAPVGFVFIGAPYCWQPQMKRKLIHAIKLGNPIVVLDNTPNVAKQVSLFVKVLSNIWDRSPLSACRPFLNAERGAISSNSSAAELIQSMSPAKIMKHIEKEFDSSGMNADERLTLSDIVGLLDLVKRRPQVFKETVFSVDPLRDSGEHTISRLMSVFTSPHACTKELNSTDLHRSLVLKGWDLHLRLVRRATNLRRFATTMVVTIATLMLLGTVLAMIRIWLKFHGVFMQVGGGGLLSQGNMAVSAGATEANSQHFPHEQTLNISLVVLPICVLLLMTIQGSFQIAQSWASYHMGASKVVAEIYLFLGGVAPYDQAPAVNQQRFLKRLRDMVKRLSVSGIREEDLVRSANGEQAAPNTDLETLQGEIHKSLYGIEPLCLPCRWVRDLLRSCCDGSTWGALLDGPTHRDLAAPINAEAYMEIRMAPLKKYYGERVRAISRLRTILYCALMLVICVSVGLGADDHFSIWIPATLGIVTFLATITHWLTPPEIIVAINSAITMIQKMELRFQGAEIRESRSDVTKQRLISATEQMVLAVERAMCRATAVPEADDDDRELDEGDNDGTNESKREQRSRTISVAVTPMNVGSGAATPLGIAHARNSQEQDDEFGSQRYSRRRTADKFIPF